MRREMKLTKEHVQLYFEKADEKYRATPKVRSFSPEFFEALDDYILEWGPDSIQIVDEDE